MTKMVILCQSFKLIDRQAPKQLVIAPKFMGDGLFWDLVHELDEGFAIRIRIMKSQSVVQIAQ